MTVHKENYALNACVHRICIHKNHLTASSARTLSLGGYGHVFLVYIHLFWPKLIKVLGDFKVHLPQSCKLTKSIAFVQCLDRTVLLCWLLKCMLYILPCYVAAFCCMAYEPMLHHGSWRGSLIYIHYEPLRCVWVFTLKTC